MEQPPTDSSSNTRRWRFRDVALETGRTPLLMGIVNVTPDSFSDGGEFLQTDAAVAHALQLVEDGADILDVGGESTRPGATPVSIADELRRVIPVIQRLARETSVPISIDTMKAEVAQRAADAGAVIVNDVSGLTFDPAMPTVCRDADVGVIVMHMQGTPQTMQNDPQYADVITELCDYFTSRLETLQQIGIPHERIVFDPGVGFGKTAEHNVEILSNVHRFRSLGRPVLIGHSRKRFLKKIVGRPVEERNAGTLGVSLALAQQSADLLRVHDIRATRDALTAYQLLTQS